MERTIIAFALMALLLVAGIAVGLYLRHNSRARTILRDAARDRARWEARADDAG